MQRGRRFLAHFILRSAFLLGLAAFVLFLLNRPTPVPPYEALPGVHARNLRTW
ncbi:MAG: hypothetical protein R3272_09710 [Candidatus Promineifilaceae bacterium]|nr:hypothetical protein [Candidatus Promineifilaceae bacterium]